MQKMKGMVVMRLLNQTEGAGAELTLFLGVAVVLILLGSVFGLALLVTDFSRELRYLNIEIGRTEGEERQHYIRQRRRLWLSLLPFVHY